MSDNKEVISSPMWRAALLVATQSFTFGYVFACLNSCLVTGDDNSGSDCYHNEDDSCPKGTIYNDMDLTTAEASFATTAVVLGAWIGCVVGSTPSELYGRKFTLMGNNVLFIIGAALSCSGAYYALLVGKLISGLGVGIASVIPPVLLAEMSTSGTRGTITTLHQLLITLAIFVVAMVAFGFVGFVNHGWQYVQAFGALPPIFMFLFSGYIPESPKWMLSQLVTGNLTSQEEDAIRAQVAKDLTGIRNEGHNVAAEIEDILTDARAEAAASQDQATWGEVFANKRAIYIGCGLTFFQAMSGINSVLLYSTTIFGLAGFQPSIVGTAIFGIVFFLATFGATYLVDITGRKTLLTVGTAIMFASLMILSSILLAPLDDKLQGWVAVFAVLFYGIGFALGLGAVVWVVLAEIMPSRLRMKAFSLFLSINWGCSLIIGLLTLIAIDALGGAKNSMDDDEYADAEKKGVAYVYFFFGLMTVCCLFFLRLFVPETQGKTPDEVFGTSSTTTPLLRADDRM